MAPAKLSDAQVSEWIAANPNWTLGSGGDRILAVYEFSDFADAMAFMNAVAPQCDQMNHHPEWRNIYNKVWVELTTHDSGGLTESDLQLARFMDAAATG